MRQLFPPQSRESIQDVEPEQHYLEDHREPHHHRPWVTVNMAVTVDGATALGGRSGGIGGPNDRKVFHALRSAADVILVGAGTARAENYGPVSVPPDLLAFRHSAGRSTPARLAIVSASGNLDVTSRLFSDPTQRPIIYTTATTAKQAHTSLSQVAEVVVAGSSTVVLDQVMEDLIARNVRCVVCEGGPSLNGQLIEAGLIDEWCMTLSPSLSSGASARAAHSAVDHPPLALTLDRLLFDGHDLFARYLAS